jgi:hypothetical protein
VETPEKKPKKTVRVNYMTETFRWKYFLVILILFSLGLVLFYSAHSKTRNAIPGMHQLLLKEVKEHPKMQIQDLYKFLHQAAMGSEHAVKDTAMVRVWLKNEISGLDLSQESNLLDTLSADGTLVRVNLCPYIKSGYDLEKLLNAFIKTANNFKGSIEQLREYFVLVKKMIRNNELPFKENEFDDFISQQKGLGFPAIHHSEEYVKVYKPAYRVISSVYLADIIN